MEKAIKLNLLDINTNKVKGYDSVCFGTEFCENLIPVMQKNLTKVFSLNKIICILTPIISDKGLKNLVPILKQLKYYNNFEITINDWGTLVLIKELDLKCKINIGRHLSKLFFTVKKNYIEINNANSINFLKSIGINTFEVSNFLFSKEKIIMGGLENENIKFNIYYPFVLLSTTRTCLIGLKDISDNESIETINCKNECLLTDYYVKTSKIKEKLIISQNSTFIKNNNFCIDKDLKLNVNRTVFCVRP